MMVHVTQVNITEKLGADYEALDRVLPHTPIRRFGPLGTRNTSLQTLFQLNIYKYFPRIYLI